MPGYKSRRSRIGSVVKMLNRRGFQVAVRQQGLDDEIYAIRGNGITKNVSYDQARAFIAEWDAK